MMDMMERGRLKLDKIEYVVLDEADEMLKMGFAEDIEKILSGVAKEDPRDNTHQTLLYSATMPSWVKQVSSKYLKPDHKHVDLVGNDANKTAAGPFPLAIVTSNHRLTFESCRGIRHLALSCFWHQRPAILDGIISVSALTLRRMTL